MQSMSQDLLEKQLYLCVCVISRTVYLRDLLAFVECRAYWCSSGEAEAFV